MSVTIARPFVIASLAVVLAAGLGACREHEQGRPMSYEKGVYGGQMDDPLTDEARQRLRQRHTQNW